MKKNKSIEDAVAFIESVNDVISTKGVAGINALLEAEMGNEPEPEPGVEPVEVEPVDVEPVEEVTEEVEVEDTPVEEAPEEVAVEEEVVPDDAPPTEPDAVEVDPVDEDSDEKEEVEEEVEEDEVEEEETTEEENLVEAPEDIPVHEDIDIPDGKIIGFDLGTGSITNEDDILAKASEK